MIDPAGPFGAAATVGVAMVVLIPAMLAIVRRLDPIGISLSVLAAGVTTSIAALGAVTASSTTRPWFVVVVVVAYVFAALRLFVWRVPAGPTNTGDWPAFAGAVVAALPALVFLYRAPMQWDARSIWYLHASWFAGPSSVYTELVTYSSEYKFTHVDYPPLTPSLAAFAWLFGDSTNDWTAQIVTGLLTLAAIAVLVILVTRGAPIGWWRFATAVVAGVVILGVIRGNSLDGYVDGLTAVLLAALAVAPFRERDGGLVVVVAIAAALAKNEGLALLVVAIVPLYLVVRRRMTILLLPGVAVGAFWAVRMRMLDAELHRWRPENVLPWSEGFVDRAVDIAWTGMTYASILLPLLLWVGVVMLGVASGWSRVVRREVLVLGALALWMFLVIVAMYLASPHDDLAWHLRTSADRLIMHPSLVFAAAGLSGSVAILTTFIGRRRATSDDPITGT